VNLSLSKKGDIFLSSKRRGALWGRFFREKNRTTKEGKKKIYVVLKKNHKLGAHERLNPKHPPWKGKGSYTGSRSLNKKQGGRTERQERIINKEETTGKRGDSADDPEKERRERACDRRLTIDRR